MVLYFRIVLPSTSLVSKIVIIRKIKLNVSLVIIANECEVRGSLGWANVYGYNMSCLKNYVMREPLIDTVDKRQICTDHFALKVK